MVRICDEVVKRMELAKVFKDNTQTINSLNFHHEGEFAVTASDDESIRVYNCDTGQEHKVTFSKKYGVDTVRFTHSATTVVCASKNNWDQTIRYLSLHDNKYLRYFKGHRDRVVSLEMCPTNDTFMSGSLDETIRLWDLRSNSCQGLLRVKGRPSVAFDPQGVVFAAGMGDNKIKLYDVRSFDKGPFDTFEVQHGDEGAQWVSMSFSPDGKYLLCSSDREAVILLDAFEGALLQSYDGRQNQAQMPIVASFSPDGQYVTSGSDDGCIWVWNAVTGAKVAKWSGHAETPSVVEWNPRKLMVASACQCLAFWIPTSTE